MTYSGTLTTVTCWCGMRHAVPTELREHQQRQHQDGRPQDSIYCPLGHRYVIAGKGEAEVLRQQLATARRSRDATRDLLDHEQRSHAATRGHLTRTRKRAAHGVCPCCKRTFQQLDRHMKAKHPNFVKGADNV